MAAETLTVRDTGGCGGEPLQGRQVLGVQREEESHELGRGGRGCHFQGDSGPGSRKNGSEGVPSRAGSGAGLALRS